MTKRHALIAAIVLLVVLNVWRWWPAADSATNAAPQAAARSAAPAAAGVPLAVRTPTSMPPRIERNPFQMGSRSAAAPSAPPRPPGERLRPAGAVVPVSLPVEAAPPPRTAEEIEAEVVQLELGQIKLVGVIVRDAKPQAYFAHGDRTYLVSVGDAVGRFAVAAISAESAKLRDPATGQSRVIPVLGK